VECGKGILVNCVRCYNAGENMKFKEKANSVDWQLISADLFTKNAYGSLFEKHIRKYVGFDGYVGHELAGVVD
jgi:hypothetical protein